MIKTFLGGVLVCLLQISLFAQTYSLHPYLSGGIDAGYANGLSFQGNITVHNFAVGFPLSLRLGIGYVSIDPGNPAEARSMFVNDNTNGVPEKSGTVWNFRMDFVYPVSFFPIKRSDLFVGPRYSMFDGTFSFIDGNEVFSVLSNQWGLGLGADASFAITSRIDMVLTTGFDYYFLSTLEGHDTSYSPNGYTVNGRLNYNYASVDNAINQPKFVYRALMGFNYFF